MFIFLFFIWFGCICFRGLYSFKVISERYFGIRVYVEWIWVYVWVGIEGRIGLLRGVMVKDNLLGYLIVCDELWKLKKIYFFKKGMIF